MGINRRWQSLCWGAALVTTLGFAAAPALRARAIQLSDGTVYFAQVPRLVDARTTHKGVGVWGATYYFTLSLPADAGEPLQRVTFAQTEGVDHVDFNLRRTRAYLDARRRRAASLDAVAADPEGRVSAYFDPPIQPGETVTIGLRPDHNPYTGGVYLFGVTAFPAGGKGPWPIFRLRTVAFL